MINSPKDRSRQRERETETEHERKGGRTFLFLTRICEGEKAKAILGLNSWHLFNCGSLTFSFRLSADVVAIAVTVTFVAAVTVTFVVLFAPPQALFDFSAALCFAQVSFCFASPRFVSFPLFFLFVFIANCQSLNDKQWNVATARASSSYKMAANDAANPRANSQAFFRLFRKWNNKWLSVLHLPNFPPSSGFPLTFFISHAMFSLSFPFRVSFAAFLCHIPLPTSRDTNCNSSSSMSHKRLVLCHLLPSFLGGNSSQVRVMELSLVICIKRQKLSQIALAHKHCLALSACVTISFPQTPNSPNSQNSWQSAEIAV